MLVYFNGEQKQLLEVVKVEYFEEDDYQDECIEFQLLKENDGEDTVILDRDDLTEYKKAFRNLGFRTDSIAKLFEDIVEKLMKNGKVTIPL